jgi:hypothetical protein
VLLSCYFHALSFNCNFYPSPSSLWSGTPIVTLPSEQQPGQQFASGLYAHMGLEHLIAQNTTDFARMSLKVRCISFMDIRVYAHTCSPTHNPPLLPLCLPASLSALPPPMYKLANDTSYRMSAIKSVREKRSMLVKSSDAAVDEWTR